MDVKIIIKIISLILIALGTVMIFDARRLSKKLFSYSDRNTSTKILKILGFGIAIFGCIIIVINI